VIAAFAVAAAAAVAGDALGVCELMLGLPRMSQLTADSMVQALLVPASTFLQLVGAVAGILLFASCMTRFFFFCCCCCCR
jgi:CRP-like cAMP-binding protein